MAIKRILINKLQVGMSIAHPVFVRHNNKYILLMSDNTLIVRESQIRRLLNAGISTVEIDTEKGLDTFHSLSDQKKWNEIAVTAKDFKATKSILARHMNVLITSFTNIITKNYTSRMLLGENRVALILKEILLRIQNNSDLLMSLIRLKSVNEYTFNHSVNVTVVCVSFANDLGFSFTDTIRFGTATLFADIGMTNYPSSMVQRPSGLSKKERDELQKHPVYALDFLKSNGIQDNLIETVILQHHERYDGTGYPFGLKDEEIHSISKLFSIADVYVAMTSPRPKRTGFPPHMVLADILRMSGTYFDPHMSKYFIKKIGVFPVGNMVELTSGRLGLVASLNKSDPLRPVVILFNIKRKLSIPQKIKSEDDKNIIISRGQWELVDLARESELYGKIKRGLDHRKFNINPSNYLDQI